jgi:hypothetical protein
VWTLALDLGVPAWVAPLVAPAVDLSVLGLLLAIRYLALHGASRGQLRPARRLLIFSSLMTLALNVAAPLIAGEWGKAAFDAVGPLLLMGWAEVAPGLLQAMSGIQGASVLSAAAPDYVDDEARANNQVGSAVGGPTASCASAGPQDAKPQSFGDDLLERARQEDAHHRQVHQRPISAETLRKRLRVGAARSRMLVAMVRANSSGGSATETSGTDSLSSR